jgi:7-cyano-7-deazaguanine synthase
MEAVTVMLSGGLDSACAAAVSGATAAVAFNYGQRHVRELEAARDVAAAMGMRLSVVNLAGLLHGSALLGDGPVPHGRYDAPSMAATVVPGRNLLFAAAAVASLPAGASHRLVAGVHAGDHPVYPDCRPAFWSALGEAVRAYGVRLDTPFIAMTKAEALAAGAAAGAPVGLTWSCYEGGSVHCGRCGTCVERAEAFDLAGIGDPTRYADAAYWRTAGA